VWKDMDKNPDKELERVTAKFKLSGIKLKLEKDINNNLHFKGVERPDGGLKGKDPIEIDIGVINNGNVIMEIFDYSGLIINISGLNIDIQGSYGLDSINEGVRTNRIKMDMETFDRIYNSGFIMSE
jgi:hypothetical protein